MGIPLLAIRHIGIYWDGLLIAHILETYSADTMEVNFRWKNGWVLLVSRCIYARIDTGVILNKLFSVFKAIFSIIFKSINTIIKTDIYTVCPVCLIQIKHYSMQFNAARRMWSLKSLLVHYSMWSSKKYYWDHLKLWRLSSDLCDE